MCFLVKELDYHVIEVVKRWWAPDWVRLVVNTVLTVVVAGWGEFVLGYGASYEECFQDSEKTGQGCSLS